MRKEITSQFRLSEFKSTPCYRQLVEFIQSLAEAVAGKALTDECLVSPAVQCVLDDLQQMSEWVAEIPPMQQAMRYGNKAFIAWYKKLCGVSKGMAAKLLEARNAAPAAGLSVEQAGAELAVYLTESFGNATRIDYGTGHELAFAAFLCGGERIGCFTADDRPALVLRVFDKYLSLMRLLQTTYWLEPAGSHGVWGLDDYQHLPFFFGAAQLSTQHELKPSCVHNEAILEAEHGKWMYLAAVRFIRQVKKGPFREHSPYLNDISGVDTWQKIGVGLRAPGRLSEPQGDRAEMSARPAPSRAPGPRARRDSAHVRGRGARQAARRAAPAVRAAAAVERGARRRRGRRRAAARAHRRRARA